VDPDRLRGLGPFTGLDEAGRARVAALLELRQVPAGADLVVEGEPVRGLAVLLTGEARVCRHVGGRDRELARIGRGAFVGELSLLDHRATGSATVTVVRDAEVAVPVSGLGEDLLADPVVGPAVRAVARRRRATNRVAALGPVRTTLVDGTPIDLRPMWPDDWHLMEAGRARTSRESLHQRFFSIPKLTETTLRRLATVDYVDDFAWVALDPQAVPDSADDLLGVGRYGRLPDDRHVAEVALLVSDDQQGRGLGARLLAALAVAADEHGIDELEAVALASNRAIRRLLSSAGATWRTDPADVAFVHARWPVADALAQLADVADLEALRGLVRQALSESD
jgi:CRP-like cAMP-binding protein